VALAAGAHAKTAARNAAVRRLDGAFFLCVGFLGNGSRYLEFCASRMISIKVGERQKLIL
jgi:hypothetical protein